jgi:hypothetical protein
LAHSVSKPCASTEIRLEGQAIRGGDDSSGPDSNCALAIGKKPSGRPFIRPGAVPRAPLPVPRPMTFGLPWGSQGKDCETHDRVIDRSPGRARRLTADPFSPICRPNQGEMRNTEPASLWMEPAAVSACSNRACSSLLPTPQRKVDHSPEPVGPSKQSHGAIFEDQTDLV